LPDLGPFSSYPGVLRMRFLHSLNLKLPGDDLTL
jgi:hypothetical protein